MGNPFFHLYCSLQHVITARFDTYAYVFSSSAFVYLQEVRRVWLGYMSQCDSTLGQKLAAKVQAASQM